MLACHEAPSMAGHTLVSFALELSVYACMCVLCVHARTFDRPQFCSEIVRCYHPFPGAGGDGVYASWLAGYPLGNQPGSNL